jgi:hypothetical protein
MVQRNFPVSKEGSKIMTFYFGLSVGFVASHWMVFCSLLFNKTCRASHFSLLDKNA